jgi:hypothetical protein
MKLLARVLPLALALLVPSAALAEGGKPPAKDHHAAHAKPRPAKKAKAKAKPQKPHKAPKAHKPKPAPKG